MASFDRDLFEFLIKLEEKAQLRGPLGSELNTLLLTVAFLNALHSCQLKWEHVEENGSLKFLHTRIYNGTLNANMELRSLAAGIKLLCPDLDPKRQTKMPMNTVELISGMLERLRLLSSDIQQLHTVLSNSSRTVTYLNYEDAMEVLEFLGMITRKVEGILNLLTVMKELNAITHTLKLLRYFIGFTVERSSYRIGKQKDLLIHVECMVENVLCLLYLVSSNHEKMNDEKLKAVKLELSSAILKIIPAREKVKDIYIKALKTSKSELGVFDQWSYLDSFFKYARKLSIKLGLPRSNIEFLHKELNFFRELLDESLVKDHQKDSHFREVLTAVIISSIRAIICYFNDDEKNKGVDFNFTMAVYDLQQFFLLKRQNATEADCIYLQKPWRFLGPDQWQAMISQLDFLLKKPPYELCSQTNLARQELEPLYGVFIAFQSELHEDLEIQRRRLIRLLDHANFVITSFNYGVPLWSCKLELYNVIQKIRKIKMEIGDSRNRCTDDAEIFQHIKHLSNGDKKMQTLSIVGVLELGELPIIQLLLQDPMSTKTRQLGRDQLECLETNMDFTSPLKDEVHILRLNVSFLRIFLNCKGKWHIEDGNLKVNLNRIQNLFQNANLRKLWADIIQFETTGYGDMPMNMEHMLSSIQESVQFLYSDVQQVYTILSKSSRYITCMTDKAVTDNLHSLLENIEDLLRFNLGLVSPIKEELKALETTLRFFIDLICFTAKRCNTLGTLRDLLVLAEILVDNFSCLLYLCCIGDKLNHQMMKATKMQLLAELKRFSPVEPNAREMYIKSLKASKSMHRNPTLVDEFWGFLESLRDYILVLSNSKMWSTTSFREDILLLHRDVPFLITYFAMDLPLDEHIGNDHHIFMDILERTSAMIIEIGHVNGHNDQQDDIHKKFSNFLVDIYFPGSFRCSLPKTNGQGFIGSLLGNLKQLLNTRAHLVAPLKYQIEAVHEELLSVREDFNRMAKQLNQCEQLQTQWSRFIDSAYHIEYIIDSFLVGCGTLSYHKLVLFNLLEQINTIKMELKVIKDKIIGDKVIKSSCVPSHFSTEVGLSSKQQLVKEKYIAEHAIFPKAKEEIIEHLTYGVGKLKFLSIVGMPGIGKTTLADSVFQHSSVTNHFHVRARCCISQVYDKRRLLLEILEQVTSKSIECKDVYDLEKELYECLKGRRYLIFMDDIWSIRPWHEIMISFPNDGNGSRIMFTSRFNYIASQVGPDSINRRLSPLPAKKSWMMLERKIFGDKRCPTNDLVNLGCEIAAKCKGLPLTIDLIAGVLRGKETNIKEWKKVADSMKDYLHDPQGQCQKVLELSYQDLPEELRPFFLYFSTFPEDADIQAKVLILLWIAEGFVQLQKDDQRCLEDVAKDILENLINRSLVIISKQGLPGRVKSTRIHDLLHNFASTKAREERFMLKVDGSPLSSDGYRLCFLPGNWDEFPGSCSSSTTARSLTCLGLPLRPISWQLNCFKLLRVLNIPDIAYDPYPTIFTLIHLRFLAIFPNSSNMFSLIHKLLNLETIFLYNPSLFEPCFPLNEACSRMRLRHLFSLSSISLGYSKENVMERSFQFDNLRTLHNVRVSYADNIEKIFKLMPNLVLLKVEFYNPDGGYYPFPKLDFLEKLESLQVKHDCIEYPCKIFNFPPYLNTLVLSNFRLPWTKISELGNFKKLLYLNLGRGSFLGAIWDMNGGQFPNLKSLILNDLGIEEWNVTEDSFSCLEQLRVQSCRKLKELPCCLAEVIRLQQITLYRCRSSVLISAKIIKEEQEASGNYQFVLKTEETFDDEDSNKECLAVHDLELLEIT